MLTKKEKENPGIQFVKDYDRVLQKLWRLNDDKVNLLLLDRNHKILYVKKGNIEIQDIEKALQIATRKRK